MEPFNPRSIINSFRAFIHGSWINWFHGSFTPAVHSFFTPWIHVIPAIRLLPLRSPLVQSINFTYSSLISLTHSFRTVFIQSNFIWFHSFSYFISIHWPCGSMYHSRSLHVASIRALFGTHFINHSISLNPFTLLSFSNFHFVKLI